jgi:hypothetical protein
MPPQFYTADQTAPAQNLCRYQWLKQGVNEKPTPLPRHFGRDGACPA